jgi:hypothetical protein
MECKNSLFGVSFIQTEEIEDAREAEALSVTAL